SHRRRSPSSPSGAIAPQRPAAPWRSPTSCGSYPKYCSTDLDRRDPDRPSWTYHDRRRGSRSSTVGGRSPDSRQPGWLRRLSRHRQALARGERPRKKMRLASKIFLTSAVVVVVLAGVGVLSLRAIGRLASVNREITTRTVPALRLASSTRDAIPTLVRLEARFLVLDDPRFMTAWNERSDRLRGSLVRLREYATNGTEARLLDDATESFERYYGTVGQIQMLV